MQTNYHRVTVDDPGVPTGLEQTRMPPSNTDAEVLVLGSILLNENEPMQRAVEMLPTADFFYLNGHKAVYQACLALYYATPTEPTDLLTVADWLRNRKQLDKIGGAAFLQNLVDRTVSSSSLRAHAALIRKKYFRRQLIKAGQEIYEIGYREDIPEEEALAQSEKRIFDINRSHQNGGFVHIADASTEAFNVTEKRSLQYADPNSNECIVLKTGYYDYDQRVSWKEEELIVIAGRPGTGKTTFLTSVTVNIASQRHAKSGLYSNGVGIVSLEMPKRDLLYRMQANVARIDSKLIQEGRLQSNQWEPLGHAVSFLSNLPIYFDDTPGQTLDDVRSKSISLKSNHPELKLLLIDYLQLIKGGPAFRPGMRYEEVSYVVRELKELARFLKIRIVAFSQLNRELEKRLNKRPIMPDMRETGEIEQAADHVGALYRDELYNPDTNDLGVMELITLKQRSGPIGTDKLLFIPEFNRIDNLALARSR